MRTHTALLAVVLLAACEPPAPVEQGGVGFGTYTDFRAQREAELAAGRTSVVPPQTGFAPGPVTTYTPPGGASYSPGTTYAGTPGGITSGPITSGPIGSTPTAAPVATTAPVATASMAPLPAADPNNTGISDEQDFAAVSARESIQSDKARIDQNSAQYQEVAPTALPEREGNSASPIIEYAINAPNRLGQPVYQRSSISLANSQKACGRYASPAEAQEAFLKSGGPRRDPKNLDPDGDGFACTWDPTPFQRVRG